MAEAYLYAPSARWLVLDAIEPYDSHCGAPVRPLPAALIARDAAA